jgi:hypothetical protein
MKRSGRGAFALGVLLWSSAALARPGQEQPAAQFTADEIAAVGAPDLRFTPSPQNADEVEKYVFYHRKDTDFATAYADIVECDNFARGIAFHTASTPVPYPYTGTLAGALGGAIGDAMADAIYGSAARRLTRRTNLRTCMGYKEYDRYGLPKEIWQTFNFEEGNRVVREEERHMFLMIQAKVASGPTPLQGALPR